MIIQNENEKVITIGISLKCQNSNNWIGERTHFMDVAQCIASLKLRKMQNIREAYQKDGKQLTKEEKLICF